MAGSAGSAFSVDDSTYTVWVQAARVLKTTQRFDGSLDTDTSGLNEIKS